MENLMLIFGLAWGIITVAIVVLLLNSLFNYLKKPNTKLKKWLKKRKEKKLQKAKEKIEKKLVKDDSKQQIKKYNKNKKNINFKALKFEYSQIYSIINSIVANQNKKNVSVSEVYLIKFDEYYKKVCSYNQELSGEYPLLKLACLVKAIIGEPLLKAQPDFNIKILDLLIEAFYKKGITYAGKTNPFGADKADLIKEIHKNYRLYNDDVFLVTLYVIERIQTLNLC